MLNFGGVFQSKNYLKEFGSEIFWNSHRILLLHSPEIGHHLPMFVPMSAPAPQLSVPRKSVENRNPLLIEASLGGLQTDT